MMVNRVHTSVHVMCLVTRTSATYWNIIIPLACCTYLLCLWLLVYTSHRYRDVAIHLVKMYVSLV